MKKNILLCLFTIATISINAQTIAWSSDLEDLTGWSILDFDEDGINWGFYSGGGESFGFSPGAIAFSQSWDSSVLPDGAALTPDNLLYTPNFSIPANALSITFKVKVASVDDTFFAEKFAVLVYDENDFDNTLTIIHEETLTAGGDNSAKDITASINPNIFSGKTIGLIVRHYECTDQNQILMDDFEVSYSTTLATIDNKLEIAGVYPNPIKDIVTIKTQSTIDSAIIMNQLGQKVMNIKSNNIFNNSINLSPLRSGVYFLTLKSEERRATIRIIKK